VERLPSQRDPEQAAGGEDSDGRTQRGDHVGHVPGIFRFASVGHAPSPALQQRCRRHIDGRNRDVGRGFRRDQGTSEEWRRCLMSPGVGCDRAQAPHHDEITTKCAKVAARRPGAHHHCRWRTPVQEGNGGSRWPGAQGCRRFPACCGRHPRRQRCAETPHGATLARPPSESCDG